MAWTTEVETTRRPAGMSHVVGVYYDRIRAKMDDTVESIVATGAELAEAKQDLDHGQFGPLLEALGLHPRVAQRYMVVAARFANATPGSHLPAAPSVLYELARLDDDELADAIESGAVSPSTTRSEAQALTRPEPVEPEPSPSPESAGATDTPPVGSDPREPEPVKPVPDAPDPADVEEWEDRIEAERPKPADDPQSIVEAIAGEIYDDAAKCWDAVKKATESVSRELFRKHEIALLAEALSDDDLTDLDRFADLVRERTEAIRAAKPTGLRVVQGGR